MERRLRTGRRGVSLIELVVALICSLIVLTLSLRALADLGVLVRRTAATSTRLQTVRTARVLLRAELTSSGPRGIRSVAPDSVSLRVFRGTARACPDSDGDARLLVAPVGLRRVAPAKDSVLLLEPDGRWVARDIVSASGTSDRCSLDPELVMEWWTIVDPPDEAVLVRYFESGSYHLSGDALRYRIGRSGRQPITGAALGGATFTWGNGRIGLALGVDGDLSARSLGTPGPVAR